MLYNDAYAEILGAGHPATLGPVEPVRPGDVLGLLPKIER